MLLSEMETQKQAQGTARPPILPIPSADRPTFKIERFSRRRKGKLMMNLQRIAVSLAALALAAHLAFAQQTRADAEKDPVLKAMLTELDRKHDPAAVEGLRQAVLHPVPH
jgi:hypothetical protein